MLLCLYYDFSYKFLRHNLEHRSPSNACTSNVNNKLFECGERKTITVNFIWSHSVCVCICSGQKLCSTRYTLYVNRIEAHSIETFIWNFPLKAENRKPFANCCDMKYNIILNFTMCVYNMYLVLFDEMPKIRSVCMLTWDCEREVARQRASWRWRRVKRDQIGYPIRYNWFSSNFSSLNALFVRR